MNRPDMIDRYLQAVGFWLPRNQKDDILAELSEDLQSQIEDREEELGRPLDQADLAAILKKRGRPVFVAGRFQPQHRLIGPALYPIYIMVLKIVALFYLLPWFIIWLGIIVFDSVQSRLHISGGIGSLGTLWTQAFIQFGIITLVFAVIDRVSANSCVFDNWDPSKLPKLKTSKAVKRGASAVAGMIFGIVGLIWLLAVPQFPFLILGPAAYALKAAPIWASIFPLIVIRAVAGILENLIVLLRPQITWLQPVLHIATNAFTLWIISLLLPARTYLLATDPHFSQYAVIANWSILASLAGTGLGLAIALILDTWRAVQALSRPQAPQAARIA
jgi:hypothetical protein